MSNPPSSRRGSALLAVLWVSAALAAIGFSLASTVREETDRTSTSVDGLRAYYLAAGSIYRAAWELLWSLQNSAKPLIPPYATHADYTFPTGQVHVDFIPETAKLNINITPPEELYRLCVALGIDAARAREIALAIVDWRAPRGEGPSFDEFYATLTPSFRPPHASFQEIEELLLVKGVTPDIFYGTYVPAAEPGAARNLLPRQGLADCLSVYGSRGAVDVNTAAPAVLAAIGIPPDVINVLVERRRATPFTPQALAEFVAAYGVNGARLRVGRITMLTIRATARMRAADGTLSDLRRSVAAQVKYASTPYAAPMQILRWYDTAWSF